MSRLALCEHRHVRASCPTCNPEGAEEPTGAAVRVREKILRPVTDSLARAGVWDPERRTAAEAVDLLRQERDAERRFARRVQAWLAEQYGEDLEHPDCPPDLRAAVLERMAGPPPRGAARPGRNPERDAAEQRGHPWPIPAGAHVCDECKRLCYCDDDGECTHDCEAFERSDQPSELVRVSVNADTGVDFVSVYDPAAVRLDRVPVYVGWKRGASEGVDRLLLLPQEARRLGSALLQAAASADH